MHIAVCIKQILDPEISPRAFRINPETKRAEQGSASLVPGPFDLNALEVAVQLKESCGAKVTAVTFGPERAQDVLRRVLAMGADEALHVVDEAPGREPAVTARVLAAALRMLGKLDLVLCGRQSGEWDDGQVPGLLAAELGWPYVPFVPRLAAAGAGFRLERESDVGGAVVQAPRGVVVSITNAQDNSPRLPKVRDIMLANRKPIRKVTPVELGVEDALQTSWVEVLDLFVPEVVSRCEFIEGDSGAEKAANLVKKLLERKVI